MRKRTMMKVVAGLAILSTAMSACSSSKATSGGSNSTGSKSSNFKIGVLTDLTGPYSSAFLTSEQGVKAYVNAANASGGIAGHTISYVMGDTTSTPAGAVTAAQRMVQNDKVQAIIDVSALFNAAEPFLLRNKIPVIGGGFDGPEWTIPSNTNLFDTVGTVDYNKLSSATGDYMKANGVTSCGSIGYANAASGPAATSIVASCKHAGLQGGYLNAQLPAGSTDMGPIAIAIKNAHVDGLSLPVVPNTAFALVGALQQLGVKLKVILLATGYGGDLLASKAAVTAAQGYQFSSVGSPVEAKNAATQKMVAALNTVGISGPPTFAEQEAYVAMAALDAGLKGAGNNASADSLMKALRQVHDFDANGLLAPGKVDFSNFSQFGGGGGAAGCIFAAVLNGQSFQVAPNTPTCGTNV